MSDIAQLGLAIDSRQVTTAKDELDKLAKSSKGADAAVNLFTSSSNAAAKANLALTASGGPARVALDQLRASFDPLFAAGLKYRDTLTDIKTAHAAGAISTAQMTSALTNTKAEFVAQSNAITGHVDKLTAGQKAMGAFRSATSGVSGQLIALSAGAGPVGVFLSALGPWGLAASIGLGAVSAALAYVREEAARMGEKAIDMRSFTAATSLTVAQVSALKKAGAEFGITGDTIQTSFERLTAGLQDARRATGPLYDDVQRINGELAKQLEQAPDVATGIDILANAYKQAGDASAKLDLSRSIFGRGGASQGPLLGKIADNGGIAQLSVALKDVSVQADATSERWAAMQAKITETEKRSKNILASIFTEEGLQASLAAAQLMERTAIAAKNLADARNSGISARGTTGPTVYSEDPSFQSQLDNVETPKLAERARATKELTEEWSKYDSAMGASVTTIMRTTNAIEATAKSTKELQDAAAAASKTQQDLITFLGSGATVADRLAGRLKDINAAYQDNRTGSATAMEATRNKYFAEQAANLDAVIQRETLRLGALGALASISEIIGQKQNEINKANQQGAGISGEQQRAIRAFTEAQAVGVIAIRQQTDAEKINTDTVGLGVGATAAYRAEQEKLADFRLRGIKLTDDQAAALHREADALGFATQRSAELRAQSDLRFAAAQVGRTDTEQAVATQLRLLYGDEYKAHLDDAIAGQIRLNSALTDTKSVGQDALSGVLRDLRDAKSAGEVFGNVLVKLENKLFDLAANKAMSAIINSAGGVDLSGLFGGTPGGTPLPGGSPIGSPTGFGHNAQGTDNWRGGLSWVGENGPELVNLPKGAQVIPNNVAAPKGGSPVSFGGGSGPITVNLMNAPAGTSADAKSSRDTNGGVRIDVMLRRTVEDTTASSIRSGEGPIDSALRERYGLSPRLA